MCYSTKLNHWVTGLHEHTTLPCTVVELASATEVDVSLVSPSGSPGVLYAIVIDTIHGAVTYCEDAVVERSTT